MTINAIFACTRHGGMSNKGHLPWPKIPEDQQWFFKHARDKVLIMGSNTWFGGLPKPIRPAINVVVTTKEIEGPDLLVRGTAEEILTIVSNKYPGIDIFVIGGEKILNLFKTHIEVLYVTKISGEYNYDVRIDLKNLTQHMWLVSSIPLPTKEIECMTETYKIKNAS
jgi:dihydrofolate reductase